MGFSHIAFYKFVEIAELKKLRDLLFLAMRERAILGTILLSEEGINGGVSGNAKDIENFQNFLLSIPLFQDLRFKLNFTDKAPFQRRMVKIRKEIVSMGMSRNSLKQNAARISPQELHQWFLEGKRFVLLDTRNNYEYRLGTFAGAHAANTEHFREFPERATHFPEEWKTQKIVSFCTGGIRCEKAAPYLASLGFQEIYQLDGGILRYLAEVGDFGWQGDCFVFDERIAVGADLKPSGAAICSTCQKVLDKNLLNQCPDCKHD